MRGPVVERVEHAFSQILVSRTKPNTNDALPLSNLTSSPNPQVHIVHPDRLDKIIPLPAHVTDTLPQELYELVISYLQDDTASLRACSLVCSAWTRTSQIRLFSLVLVRPYQLSSKAGFKFKDPVRCAVIHEKTNVIYHGIARGVYSRSLDKPDEIPVKRLNFVDIRQINIIDRPPAQGGSILIFRSTIHLYTVELPPHSDSSERPRLPKPLRWQGKQAISCYSIGFLSGIITIAAINGKNTHLLRFGHGGVTLTSYGFCTSNQLPTSLSFFGGHIICTYPKSGFERRDPTHWGIERFPRSTAGPAIQTHLAVTSVTIPGKPGGGIGTANANASTTYMVLCYDSYAIYMDDRKVLHGPPMMWHYPAKEIHFQDNHAYILSSTHLEIRPLPGPSAQNQNQGQIPVQLIEGKFRILSGKSSSKIVILREDGYVYGFKSR